MENIILPSDVTGSSAAKRYRTTARGMQTTLDLHHPAPIAYNDDAIRAPEFLRFALLERDRFLSRSASTDGTIYRFEFGCGAFATPC